MANLREYFYNVNRQRFRLHEADETVQSNQTAQAQTKPATEATTEAAADESSPEEKVKALANISDYPSFVSTLKVDDQDEKFKAFIQKYYKQSGPDKEGDGLKVVNEKPEAKDVPLSSLYPTQNELDRLNTFASMLITTDDNSKFTEGNLKEALSGTFGGYIIVYGNHIIDGHHRWSRDLALNPEGTIGAYVFKELPGVSWEDMLKGMQLVISATEAKVDTGKANPKENLFTLSAQDIAERNLELMYSDVDGAGIPKVLPLYTNYISTFIKPENMDDKKQLCRLLSAHMAKNVKKPSQMQGQNPEAGPRQDMPQTKKASTAALKTGKILLPEELQEEENRSFNIKFEDDPFDLGWEEIK